MLTLVKFLGLSVSAGVVLGFGIVGWLYLNPGDSEAKNYRGGSAVLGVRNNEGSNAGIPLVVSGGNTAETSDASTPRTLSLGPQTNSIPLGEDRDTNSGVGVSEPAPATGVPGPESFAQYDKYRENATALYGDILPGSGAAVAMGSTVTVNYTGWLTDGTQVDHSAPGKPFSFIEGEHRVISGWEEGLFGMKAGGKRRLIVPPGSGYGAAGVTSGGKVVIPPNAVLVFDVELVSVSAK